MNQNIIAAMIDRPKITPITAPAIIADERPCSRLIVEGSVDWIDDLEIEVVERDDIELSDWEIADGEIAEGGTVEDWIAEDEGGGGGIAKYESLEDTMSKGRVVEDAV